MKRVRIALLAMTAVVPLLSAASAQDAPALVFREDWTEAPAALPVTQAHVSNADLVLELHGPGGSRIKKSHHDQPADDPYYIWSGEADAPWAVTLRHRRIWMDLGGRARIRWRARQTGFRRLHLVLRLPDDVWIVSEQADGESDSWRVHDLDLAEVSWRRLDIARITEGARVARPDLTRVVAAGVTDLMRGGGTPASSRLDWIEVYGRGIPPR